MKQCFYELKSTDRWVLKQSQPVAKRRMSIHDFYRLFEHSNNVLQVVDKILTQ